MLKPVILFYLGVFTTLTRPSFTLGITEPIYQRCNEKGTVCHGIGSNCVRDLNCDYVAAIYLDQKASGDQNRPISVHIYGKIGGNKNRYIAVGFSKDGTMGEDMVFACGVQDNNIAVYSAWNPRSTSPSEMITTKPPKIETTESKQSDGKLSCSFNIPKEYSGDGQIQYNLSNKYFLLLAEGNFRNGAIEKHSSVFASRNAILSAKILEETGSIDSFATSNYSLIWLTCGGILAFLSRL